MSNDSKLNALLSAAADAGDIPGVVAAVTDREGVIYQHAAGVRRLGDGAPMSADTVCYIASMTKPITAVATLLLVQQGRLELDRPAAEVIPFLGEVRVLQGFSGDGVPQTRPPARPVTLRHLLTHTAGFANETWSAETGRCIAEHGEPNTDPRYFAALHAPLRHDPGERWWYGMGLDWAGRMIEAVSGESLGQFLRQQLFSPLGMHDTGFRLNPVLRDRLASIHQRDAEGRLAPLQRTPPDVPAYERGGGGLYSTAADYLSFIRLLLNDGRLDGETLLQPESLRLLTEDQLGGLRVEPLATALPARSRDLDLMPGIDKTWSLGFMINEQPAPSGRPAGSLSWAGINNTYFWIDRENGIGGVLLCQLFPFLDEKALPLYLSFEREVYRELV